MDTSESTPLDRTRGAVMQVVLGPEDGTPNFVTRRISIDPGGRIPCHRHDAIEHEQVVLEGSMVVGLDDQEATVAAGDCLFIPAGVAHWYENRAEVAVRFPAPQSGRCVLTDHCSLMTEFTLLRGPA
jgi:quercetin dioxygenase-like cupin family protein